jgi:uncharacterized protein
MLRLCRSSALFCGILFLICALPAHLASQTIKLERPGPREFVIDRANMIDPSDISSIQGECDELLTDHTIPLFVVTIESMGRYSSQSTAIEQFASLLYNQWGIGYLKKDGKPWNKGILLLVSRDDRMARIEVGAGYGHTEDVECRTIMENQILRRFRGTRFSAGIRTGAEALVVMAREAEGEVSLSSILIHWMSLFTPIAITIFTLVSLIRTGRRGLAWIMWGALFSFPALLLSTFGSANTGGDGNVGGSWGGGTSFSGGSFGGGFSGGGGATGSW